MKRTHGPAEIFGLPPSVKGLAQQAQENGYECPFMKGTKCDKKSRLIKYPFGICSVIHSEDNPVAICPNRFKQKNIIFRQIAKDIFGTIDNVIPLQEVSFGNIGTFDYILVKHKPVSYDIDDFCALECQSDSTTGTGGLVTAIKDFFKGTKIENKNYKFGMNTYNTIKLSFIQILIKGAVFERWKKNMIWVLQRSLFTNMTDRFKLGDITFNKDQQNYFYIYDIALNKDISEYTLELVEKKSSKIWGLLQAFQQIEVPDIEEIHKIIRKKLVNRQWDSNLKLT